MVIQRRGMSNPLVNRGAIRASKYGGGVMAIDRFPCRGLGLLWILEYGIPCLAADRIS